MGYTYEQQIGKAPVAPKVTVPVTPAINVAPMKGTTNSNFTLVGAFTSGRLGFRDLGNGQFRVRVEPAFGVTLPLPNGSIGWTQPAGGYPRYSIVVEGKGWQKPLSSSSTPIFTDPVFVA
jgi:hypothetical protein